MFVEIEKDIWINTFHISKMKLCSCHDGSFNLIFIEAGSQLRDSASYPTENEAIAVVRKIQGAT